MIDSRDNELMVLKGVSESRALLGRELERDVAGCANALGDERNYIFARAESRVVADVVRELKTHAPASPCTRGNAHQHTHLLTCDHVESRNSICPRGDSNTRPTV